MRPITLNNILNRTKRHIQITKIYHVMSLYSRCVVAKIFCAFGRCVVTRMFCSLLDMWFGMSRMFCSLVDMWCGMSRMFCSLVCLQLLEYVVHLVGVQSLWCSSFCAICNLEIRHLLSWYISIKTVLFMIIKYLDCHLFEI